MQSATLAAAAAAIHHVECKYLKYMKELELIQHQERQLVQILLGYQSVPHISDSVLWHEVEGCWQT